MKSGLGIRPPLFGQVETHRPDFGFLEAHSENYFGESIARAKLLGLRRDYPISLHGVGLSLGRADDLDANHLAQLKHLADEIDPLFVSEHLSWSAYAHRHVPDLLPLPLTEDSLAVICRHIDQMQSALGRQILVENPSNYLLFDQLQIPEPEFLNELSARTGCGLLLDVNNVHVSATNLNRNGNAFIEALNSESIGQYHLAGYTEVERDAPGGSETVLIDTHNHPVYEPVWDLFDYTLKQHGARPTLIEWDSDFPEFSELVAECDKANQALEGLEVKTIEPRTANLKSAGQSAGLATTQVDFLDAVFDRRPQLATVEPAHQHRIWIYQNNVNSAVVEYLEEVYPACRGVVGDDFFKQMAREFIRKMPPATGNIHNYGHQMSEVLELFEGLENLPYLADLIDYEWALHKAYFSANSNVLDVAGIAQDELLTMPVRLNDSVTLIRSEYPLYEIHRQSLPDFEGKVSIRLEQSQDDILVHKSAYEVTSQTLSPESFDFVQKINECENLLQAIEALQGSMSPESLSNALTLAFDLQLLCDASSAPAVLH